MQILNSQKLKIYLLINLQEFQFFDEISVHVNYTNFNIFTFRTRFESFHSHYYLIIFCFKLLIKFLFCGYILQMSILNGRNRSR